MFAATVACDAVLSPAIGANITVDIFRTYLFGVVAAAASMKPADE